MSCSSWRRTKASRTARETAGKIGLVYLPENLTSDTGYNIQLGNSYFQRLLTRYGDPAALRRLVDEARRREPGREQARIVKEAAGKFMWAMAGNLPGFEEASRALFTDDQTRFAQLICDWPRDIRRHLERLVERANHIAANPGSLHESEGATQS